MSWVEVEKPCRHDRPEPKWQDAGRIWECGACGDRAQVVRVDYGHDVMPGEPAVGARWAAVAVSSEGES